MSKPNSEPVSNTPFPALTSLNDGLRVGSISRSKEQSYSSGQLTQRPSVTKMQRLWSAQPQRRHPHHTPFLRAKDLHGSEATKVVRLTGGG